VVTDEQGAFRIDHVPDGLYEVAALRGDIAPDLGVRGPLVLVPRSPDGVSHVFSFGGPLPLQDLDAVVVNVARPLSATRVAVRCRVRWPDGTPFRSADVELIEAGQSAGPSARVSDDGSADVTAFGPGDYDLVVIDCESGDHEILRRRVHLELGHALELDLSVP